MNKYKAFYNRKEIEIDSDTSYHAQEKALIQFQKDSRKKVKSWDITIVLMAVDNKEVIHIADF